MKLTIITTLFLCAIIYSQEISVSKDSLYLAFDDDDFRSYDSVLVYNNSSTVLEINSIYSVYESGLVLDIYFSDSTIHTGVTSENNYYDPFAVSANDSAKLVFSYPLWVPKLNSVTEIWTDTVKIKSNSNSNSELKLKTIIDFPVGVEDNWKPNSFYLLRNYPNPFNPETIIEYSIPISTHVELVIYNFIGEKVIELENGLKESGLHSVNFNADNLSSGIYFVKLVTKSYQKSIKILLLK
ncbi:MAG: T9SS type A sorting domain-containing protein [Melioribacteraceae bacterium]|nr:T9SS type A sorting domain-containing protein [Melioribacteraceae bacterium]MCF8356921.1 T9SS type A sorting domain-containing protein [Melioribacteraceae bacterium]MCF8394114.1 T9SS type A sorting domain-containing protein [Melioribacteraceae bacterium]MCF8418148.1 T9SS type A sorting domain-containing protein [Melioribacteraceae bacterium]